MLSERSIEGENHFIPSKEKKYEKLHWNEKQFENSVFSNPL